MASTVVAKASPTVTAGGPATDATSTAISASSISATLANGASPGGTITFKVFGPQASAPATCTAGTTIGTTVTASGNATYNPTTSYTPATAGTYWWYVSYAGDTNNNSATGTCGAGMASTVVKNTTTATATAPATDKTSTAIATASISSVLSGGTAPTGTITFKVFGPQATAPTTCTSGGTTIGTAVTVNGNATYHPSATFTPSSAGDYWWYASYSGDTNNSADTSPCDSSMAETVVYSETSASSGLSTASASTTVASTSNFTLQPSTTYLLFAFRTSASGDSVSSFTSTGFAPAPSWTAVTSATRGTTTYLWAYQMTTPSNQTGSGKVTVHFAKGLATSSATVLDIVQLQGNDTTTPIVASTVGTGSSSSSSATANLTGAPTTGDAEAIFLGVGSSLAAPTATGTTNGFWSQNTGNSGGFYYAIPAQLNSTFSLGSTLPWVSVALEINSG